MPSVPAKREEKAEEAGGMEALHLLKSASPPLFLSPSPSLSQSARSASTFLFSSLLPACPKSPFDRLLVEGFDAEQIWQQIDLQTRPLIANLRREIKRFETNPSEITKIFGGETLENGKQANKEGFVERNEGEEGIKKEDEENESSDEENGGIDEEDEDEEDDGEEEEEEEEEEDEGHGGRGGIEDRFLKIEELEEFLEKEEAREYESSKEKHRNWDANDEEDGDNDEGKEDEEEGDMNTVRLLLFSEKEI